MYRALSGPTDWILRYIKLPLPLYNYILYTMFLTAIEYCISIYGFAVHFFFHSVVKFYTFIMIHVYTNVHFVSIVFIVGK